MSDNLMPDTDELLQVEEPSVPITPIPVVVEGQVRMQELPSPQVVVVQVFCDSTGGFIQPQRLLGEDPRRRMARIVGDSQKIRVGTSQKQVMSPDTCLLWPSGLPLPITGKTEIWVAADTATTRVSAICEQWANG